jgi:hypothetical protein
VFEHTLKPDLPDMEVEWDWGEDLERGNDSLANKQDGATATGNLVEEDVDVPNVEVGRSHFGDVRRDPKVDPGSPLSIDALKHSSCAKLLHERRQRIKGPAE